MSAPTIALVDGHYPAFKDITGLASNISIVMSATDITFEQSMLREEQAERLVLAWNQHDQLVAALRKIAKADRGKGGCYYTNRNNIGIAAYALKAAGVTP